MSRIVIAAAQEESRARLSRLLSSSGCPVFRCCSLGSDLRRTLSECEDSIVIMIGSLPDCKPDELQADYGERIQILLIGRPAALERCESPDIFRLSLPVSGQAVIGAVEMLEQLHRMRMPRRMDSEKRLVEQAKQLIMRQYGITEPEAHRELQQYAMRHGMKMTDYAAQIVNMSGRMQK